MHDSARERLQSIHTRIGGTLHMQSIYIILDITHRSFCLLFQTLFMRHPYIVFLLFQTLFMHHQYIVFLLFAVVFTLPILISLLGYHLYLCATNQTTNERYKKYYVKRKDNKYIHNVYDKGIVQNFAEVLFPESLSTQHPPIQNSEARGKQKKNNEITNGQTSSQQYKKKQKKR